MSGDKSRKIPLRAILQFIVLGLGAYSIYEPIFARNTYYDAFIQSFGITNTQFATMFSVYSTMTILLYFPGGVIADKFSPRKLLTFSFISAAALALWESTFPPYQVALLIYAGLGISHTLTFWAALIKATRQFGQTLGGESTALGSQEDVRNIMKLVVATVCVATFRHHASMTAGLQTVLRIYAAVIFSCGVISWFVFNDKMQEEQAVCKESIFTLMKKCLKNPAIWIVSLMVLGTYSMSANMSGYITNIATSNFALSAQTAATIVLISTYVQPIGSFTGGILGDKLGATKALIVSNVGLIVPAVIILLMPKTPAMAVPFTIVWALFTLVRGAARGQYYAPLREAGVPMYLSGTAVGLIATLGYSGDVFLPIISGKLLDRMEPVVAYKNFIIILVCFGIFSIIMSCIMLQVIKRRAEKEKK